jgi:hypothetical protein
VRSLFTHYPEASGRKGLLNLSLHIALSPSGPFSVDRLVRQRG